MITIVELRHCDLEIAHIGNRTDIAIQGLGESLQVKGGYRILGSEVSVHREGRRAAGWCL
jgi:hypothetical protein